MRHSPNLDADAEWAEETEDNWLEDAGGTGEPNHDIVVNSIGQDWLGSPLPAPDAFVNFETFQTQVFSSSHLYWLPITGNGANISLRISDIFTGDNSGSLTVRLFADLPPSVPTLSQWGAAVTGLALLSVGTTVFRNRRPIPKPRRGAL